MRPRSIVLFERIVLLGLALSLLDIFLSRDAAAAARPQQLSAGGLLAVQAVSVGIYLLLLWLIARRGSFMAKGIYVVLAVLGVAMGIYSLRQVANYDSLSFVIAVAQHLLAVVSIWLLFRPDTKDWFSASREALERR